MLDRAKRYKINVDRPNDGEKFDSKRHFDYKHVIGLSMYENKPKITDLLIEMATPLEIELNYDTILFDAANTNNRRLVDFALDNGSVFFRNSILSAKKHGHIEIALYLLEKRRTWKKHLQQIKMNFIK